MFRRGINVVSRNIDCVGGSHSIVASRVDDLVKAGLVSETVEEKYQGRRMLALTEKGKRVAGGLVRIEKEI